MPKKSKPHTASALLAQVMALPEFTPVQSAAAAAKARALYNREQRALAAGYPPKLVRHLVQKYKTAHMFTKHLQYWTSKCSLTGVPLSDFGSKQPNAPVWDATSMTWHARLIHNVRGALSVPVFVAMCRTVAAHTSAAYPTPAPRNDAAQPLTPPQIYDSHPEPHLVFQHSGGDVDRSEPYVLPAAGVGAVVYRWDDAAGAVVAVEVR